jgi:MFS family permease
VRSTATGRVLAAEADSSDRWGFAWVYAAHGLVHAYMLVLPSVLVLVRSHFSASWFALGVVGTLSSMAFGVFGLPAGWLTDRFGARPVLLVSLIGPALASLLAALAQDLVSLGAALFILGLCGAFYHPAALTLITLQARRGGRALGLQGVVGNIGMGIAPVSLAATAALTSWRGAFALMAILGLIFSYGAWRGLPARAARPTAADSHPPERPTASLRGSEDRVRLPPLLLVYLASLVVGFVYTGYVAFLPAYLAGRSPLGSSGVMAGGGLATVVLFFGILGQWSGGRMAERRSLRAAYAGALGLGGVVVASMSAFSGWMLVAMGALFSLLLFSCQPMGNALLAFFTPSGRRGLAYGVAFTFSFGVGSLANASLGYLADRAGLQAVFVGLGAATVPGLLAVAALALGVGTGKDMLHGVHRSEVRR